MNPLRCFLLVFGFAGLLSPGAGSVRAALVDDHEISLHTRREIEAIPIGCDFVDLLAFDLLDALARTQRDEERRPSPVRIPDVELVAVLCLVRP